MHNFYTVITAGCNHQAIIKGGNHAKDLQKLRSPNNLIGSLKPSLSSTTHAFKIYK